jgi:hypothetical protein
MITFEKLALRACIWVGGGTVTAIVANTAFGDRSNLMLASLVGALIGVCLGWIVMQEQARLQDESRAEQAPAKLFRPRGLR